MKQHRPQRFGKLFWYPLLTVLALACAGQVATPANGPASEKAEQVFRELVPAVDQLDPLALRFDANHDRVLSPQEQAAMVAHVLEKHGEDWAGRLKKFLRIADANGDGQIDQGEWTRAVAQVRQLAQTAAEPPPAQTVERPVNDSPPMAMDLPVPAVNGALPLKSPRMKLGAYYFAGWAGHSRYDDGQPGHQWAKGMPTHFTKKLATEFAGRTPLWGWRDDTLQVMERQIDLAADNGLAYFSFCWYWSDGGGPINTNAIATDPRHIPMRLFMQAKNNQRMEFCLMVANEARSVIVGEEAWKQAADHWITLFKHPRYLRVDGQPLLVIYKARGANKEGLAYLQAQARKAGIPGVAVCCCGGGAPEDGFALRTDYCVIPPNAWAGHVSEKHPYQEIAKRNIECWSGSAVQPKIPAVTQGWDRRPWEARHGEGYYGGVEVSLYFEKATPVQFAGLLERMAHWMQANPAAVTKDRLAVIYAWNEIGEGSWLVPCKDDPAGAYLKVIRRVVLGL